MNLYAKCYNMKKIIHVQLVLIALLANSIYTIDINKPQTPDCPEYQAKDYHTKGQFYKTGNTMNYLFVGNWKMNMHFEKAINFVKDNINELTALGNNKNKSIILCPSFVALPGLIDLLQKTNVGVGAQNCSQHNKGAYTGEVSAQSLAELGCQYCIVGHSEQRKYFTETNEMVAQKVVQLCEHNIQPIICIGETKEEFESKQVYEVLTKQLTPVLKALKTFKTLPIIIAYEPVWSIGTGIIPEYSYLEQIFIWISEHIKKQLPDAKLQLLYGGSVNEHNITNLKQILYINGFLIGGASTDFQKLKKMVLL